MHVNSRSVSDDIATGNDELKDDLSAMVTPPRSSVEYSAVVCAIATHETGSDQLILIYTVPGDEIMPPSNGHKLMTPNKVQDHEIIQFSNEVEVQESPAKLLFSSPLNVSRLERKIGSIRKIHIEYPLQVNACVMELLHRHLKSNKKVAVKNIIDCFGSLLDEDDFLKRLTKSLKYKSCRLKQLLDKK